MASRTRSTGMVKGVEELAAWSGVALVGVPVARIAVETLWLGPWAHRLLGVEARKEWGRVNARKRISKFRNSGWKAVFYSVAMMWGIWAVAFQHWLWAEDGGGFWAEDAWVAQGGTDTAGRRLFPEEGRCDLVRPYSFTGALCQPMPWSIQVYYSLQVGYYMQALFCVLWRERGKSDFWIMVAHHCVTLTLLAGSLLYRAHRIGSAVLLCHDVNDAFLEVAKSARYVRRERISEFAFGVFAISWVATRLYLLPVHIIARGSWRAYEVRDVEARFGGPWGALCVWWFFNALLSSLVVMHIYWACLIFRIIARKLDGSGLGEDPRSSSDDEGGQRSGEVQAHSGKSE